MSVPHFTGFTRLATVELLSEVEHRDGWMQGRRRVLRSRLQLVKLIALVPRRVAVTALCSALLAGVLPVLLIISGGLLSSRIEAALTAGRTDAIHVVYPAFALVVGLFLLAEIMVPLQRRFRWLLTRCVDGAARERVVSASLVGSEMGRLHDPDLLSAMRRLRGLVWYSVTPGSGAAGVVGITRDYVTGFAAALVVAWFQPLLALGAVVVGLIERVRWRNAIQAIVREWNEAQDAFSEARYFVDLGLNRPAAAEVRMFGLREWLRDRISAAGVRGWNPTWRSRTRAITRETPLHLLLVVGVGAAALAWAASSAARGELSIPALIVFVPAVFTVLGLGGSFPDDNAIEYGTVMLPALETIERLAAESGVLEEGTRTRPGAPVAPSIVLRDVSFRYPAADEDVLRDVDLDIPSGKKRDVGGHERCRQDDAGPADVRAVPPGERHRPDRRDRSARARPRSLARRRCGHIPGVRPASGLGRRERRRRRDRPAR